MDSFPELLSSKRVPEKNEEREICINPQICKLGSVQFGYLIHKKNLRILQEKVQSFHEVRSKVNRFYGISLTFDGHQGTPLRPLPPRPDQPLSHLLNELRKVLGVGAKELVKLGKFSGSEEDFREAKLEVVVVEAQGLEKGLAEQPGVQAGQSARQVLFVHFVQALEARPDRMKQTDS